MPSVGQGHFTVEIYCEDLDQISVRWAVRTHRCGSSVTVWDLQRTIVGAGDS